MTELIDAVKSGDLTNLIRTIMKSGGDINAQDAEGRTALHYAAMHPSMPLLRWLLSRPNIDTSIRDKKGKTALQCASKEAQQNLTIQFSQAREVQIRKDAVKKGDAENDEMLEETDVNESDMVSPSTLRKLLLSVALPFVFLISYNGFFFATKFLVCSICFYFVSLAYFVSEVVVRPPWYHHKPHATQLTMKGCPDYWQGWINDPKTDFGLPYEDVVIESTEGYKLRGWYVPPPGGALHSDAHATSSYGKSADGAAPPHRDLGLVLVHGAGRDRRAWERHVPFLHKAGYGCLMFDMREHGLSDGGMAGVTYGMSERFDVISACRFMRTEYGYDRVCAIGTSVGGASVLMAAGIDESIDVVIAENAITTSATLCDQQIVGYMGGYFSMHRYSLFFFRVFRKCVTFWLNYRIGNKPSKHCQALHVVDRISPRPVLFMHGTIDTIVPFKHSTILYDTAREPKEMYACDGAFHCGLYNTHPEEYEERVLGFLGKYSKMVDGCEDAEAKKKD